LSITDALSRTGLRQSEAESFSDTFYRHYDRVYGVLYRLVGNRQEAEDLSQEVFLRLYRQVWQPGREHNVAAWLYRVATNVGFNALRARKHRHAWEAMPPDESLPSSQPEPHVAVERNVEQEQVRAALADLPARQATMLLLRYAGFRYRELAEICQVSPASVGTLLARAERAFEARYRERWGTGEAA